MCSFHVTDLSTRNRHIILIPEIDEVEKRNEMLIDTSSSPEQVSRPTHSEDERRKRVEREWRETERSSSHSSSSTHKRSRLSRELEKTSSCDPEYFQQMTPIQHWKYVLECIMKDDIYKFRDIAKADKQKTQESILHLFGSEDKVRLILLDSKASKKLLRELFDIFDESKRSEVFKNSYIPKIIDRFMFKRNIALLDPICSLFSDQFLIDLDTNSEKVKTENIINSKLIEDLIEIAPNYIKYLIRKKEANWLPSPFLHGFMHHANFNRKCLILEKFGAIVFREMKNVHDLNNKKLNLSLRYFFTDKDFYDLEKYFNSMFRDFIIEIGSLHFIEIFHDCLKKNNFDFFKLIARYSKSSFIRIFRKHIESKIAISISYKAAYFKELLILLKSLLNSKPENLFNKFLLFNFESRRIYRNCEPYLRDTVYEQRQKNTSNIVRKNVIEKLKIDDSYKPFNFESKFTYPELLFKMKGLDQNSRRLILLEYHNSKILFDELFKLHKELLTPLLREDPVFLDCYMSEFNDTRMGTIFHYSACNEQFSKFSELKEYLDLLTETTRKAIVSKKCPYNLLARAFSNDNKELLEYLLENVAQDDLIEMLTFILNSNNTEILLLLKTKSKHQATAKALLEAIFDKKVGTAKNLLHLYAAKNDSETIRFLIVNFFDLIRVKFSYISSDNPMLINLDNKKIIKLYVDYFPAIFIKLILLNPFYYLRIILSKNPDVLIFLFRRFTNQLSAIRAPILYFLYENGNLDHLRQLKRILSNDDFAKLLFFRSEKNSDLSFYSRLAEQGEMNVARELSRDILHLHSDYNRHSFDEFADTNFLEIKKTSSVFTLNEMPGIGDDEDMAEGIDSPHIETGDSPLSSSASPNTNIPQEEPSALPMVEASSSSSSSSSSAMAVTSVRRSQTTAVQRSVYSAIAQKIAARWKQNHGANEIQKDLLRKEKGRWGFNLSELKKANSRNFKITQLKKVLTCFCPKNYAEILVNKPEEMRLAITQIVKFLGLRINPDDVERFEISLLRVFPEQIDLRLHLFEAIQENTRRYQLGSFDWSTNFVYHLFFKFKLQELLEKVKDPALFTESHAPRNVKCIVAFEDKFVVRFFFLEANIDRSASIKGFAPLSQQTALEILPRLTSEENVYPSEFGDGSYEIAQAQWTSLLEQYVTPSDEEEPFLILGLTEGADGEERIKGYRQAPQLGLNEREISNVHNKKPKAPSKIDPIRSDTRKAKLSLVSQSRNRENHPVGEPVREAPIPNELNLLKKIAVKGIDSISSRMSAQKTVFSNKQVAPYLPAIEMIQKISELPDEVIPFFNQGLKPYQKGGVRKILNWRAAGVNGVLVWKKCLGQAQTAIEGLFQIFNKVNKQKLRALILVPVAGSNQWKQHLMEGLFFAKSSYLKNLVLMKASNPNQQAFYKLAAAILHLYINFKNYIEFEELDFSEKYWGEIVQLFATCKRQEHLFTYLLEALGLNDPLYAYLIALEEQQNPPLFENELADNDLQNWLFGINPFDAVVKADKELSLSRYRESMESDFLKIIVTTKSYLSTEKGGYVLRLIKQTPFDGIILDEVHLMFRGEKESRRLPFIPTLINALMQVAKPPIISISSLLFRHHEKDVISYLMTVNPKLRDNAYTNALYDKKVMIFQEISKILKKFSKSGNPFEDEEITLVTEHLTAYLAHLVAMQGYLKVLMDVRNREINSITCQWAGCGGISSLNTHTIDYAFSPEQITDYSQLSRSNFQRNIYNIAKLAVNPRLVSEVTQQNVKLHPVVREIKEVWRENRNCREKLEELKNASPLIRLIFEANENNPSPIRIAQRNNEAVLLYVDHIDVGQYLKHALRLDGLHKENALFLHGSQSDERQATVLAQFKQPGFRVLVMNTMLFGKGIDFPHVKHVMIPFAFTLTNNAKLNQLIYQGLSLGDRHVVHIYRYQITNLLQTAISKQMLAANELQEKLFMNRIPSLSRGQIINLFQSYKEMLKAELMSDSHMIQDNQMQEDYLRILASFFHSIMQKVENNADIETNFRRLSPLKEDKVQANAPLGAPLIFENPGPLEVHLQLPHWKEVFFRFPIWHERSKIRALAFGMVLAIDPYNNTNRVRNLHKFFINYPELDSIFINSLTDRINDSSIYSIIYAQIMDYQDIDPEETNEDIFLSRCLQEGLRIEIMTYADDEKRWIKSGPIFQEQRNLNYRTIRLLEVKRADGTLHYDLLVYVSRA